MKVLFVHDHYPSQYRHVAAALAGQPGSRVVFAARQADDVALPGVELRHFAPHRTPRADSHPYLTRMEGAVLAGQAAWRLCRQLHGEGFRPDLICAHAGFGPGLYLKQAFPGVPLLTYFEWFYRSRGSDTDFLLGELDADQACRVETLNAGILMELAACDAAVCPTRFQRDQFPAPFRGRLSVRHDGIDTDYFCPAPAGARPAIAGVDLPADAELLTYATRGMDPYRGFEPFMRAAALLLARRPRLHVVVGGADEVHYGPARADGRGHGAALRAELQAAGVDMARMHFPGPLPPPAWRDLLRRSDVHAYLTVPFVLSWSLLEAMATGCAIVGSDTAPVREMVGDGREGVLAGFFDAEGIAAAAAALLDDPARRARLGTRARARVTARYGLGAAVQGHLELMRSVASRTRVRRNPV